jgi:hypothetical protein
MSNAVLDFVDTSSQVVANEVIAWAGWEICVIPDWRPIHIEGDGLRGMMLIGKGAEPMMQVKWLQVEPEAFEWGRWQGSRVRRRGLEIVAEQDGGAFDGFAQFRESASGRMLSLFYSREAKLALEIVSLSAEEARLIEAALKTVHVYPEDRPSKWSAFGCSFVVPAGFRLRKKILNLGHQGLEFGCDEQRLVLEQVYPARLALEKRELKGWLRQSAIKDRRSRRERAEVLDCSVGDHASGMRQRSSRKFPFPISHYKPRNSLRMVVHDQFHDRLFAAEHDTGDEPEEDLLIEALSQMQWAKGGVKCSRG